jgi:hypothetical protein
VQVEREPIPSNTRQSDRKSLLPQPINQKSRVDFRANRSIGGNHGTSRRQMRL